MPSGGDTFSGLSREHQGVVMKYLKFMRAKRDIACEALEGEFRDVKSDRLYEDMYSQDDVEALLDDLGRVVKADVRQEIGTLINITSLLLKQILEGADEQGARVAIDTTSVEDRAILDRIENASLELGGEGRPVSNKLVSIKDQHQRLMEKNDELDKANDHLTSKFNKLQAESSDILRENSSLRQEVRQLEEKVMRVADDKGALEQDAKRLDSKMSEGHRTVQDLQQELEGARDLLAEAEEEGVKKLSESKQFAQLRKMLNTKSDQVVNLRRRLAKYEPDDGDTKHDDM